MVILMVIYGDLMGCNGIYPLVIERSMESGPVEIYSWFPY